MEDADRSGTTQARSPGRERRAKGRLGESAGSWNGMNAHARLRRASSGREFANQALRRARAAAAARVGPGDPRSSSSGRSGALPPSGAPRRSLGEEPERRAIACSPSSLPEQQNATVRVAARSPPSGKCRTFRRQRSWRPHSPAAWCASGLPSCDPRRIPAPSPIAFPCQRCTGEAAREPGCADAQWRTKAIPSAKASTGRCSLPRSGAEQGKWPSWRRPGRRAASRREFRRSGASP